MEPATSKHSNDRNISPHHRHATLLCESTEGSFLLQQNGRSINQPDYAGQLSYGALLKTGIPLHAPVTSCTSPEALLDALIVTQGKLKQLEMVVRMMVQERRQNDMHQSLSAEFASIMSQLFAATAGVPQQPAWSSFQAPSLALQVNDSFDFNFDSFTDDNEGSDPISVPLQASFCPPSMRCSTLTDGLATDYAMAISDQRRKEMAASLVASGNTHTYSTEIDLVKPIHNRTLENVNNNHGVVDLENQVLTEDQRDEDDDGEGESLPAGSYELVEMAATEILAEHTHFCEICGKGFKRDANLRMHMRGHGDEFKTPAALAKPEKASRDTSLLKVRRYSCPYAGCKRNKKHQKFSPLKTMLCVKNHYKRSHCPKLLICSRCKTKKFSVVADLKTHEKHCGQDKWQCSCGTTFSRKDKLIGHIGLFAGHTPAVSSAKEFESLGVGIEGASGSFASEQEEGVEGLGCSKEVISTISTSGSQSANFAASSQSMDTAHMAVVGSRIHKLDGIREQDLGKSLSFLNFTSGTLMRECPYTSSALADGGAPDTSEFQNLLADNLFHQVDDSN